MKLGSATAALFLVVVVAGAAPASAAEAIKPGKWEFTVELQMPNMPHLPPGAALPPNVQLRQGPGGMTVTHTACVNAADPTEALRRPPPPPHGAVGADAPQCKLDKLEHDGGTVTWASTCTTAEATINSQGTAHYEGERMEARFSSRTTTADGPPMTMSQHVTGRYLGPCEGQ